MLLLWKIKLVLTVNIYFDVSCATNVEIVPRRYFKCNLQTWIALYILQLLAIFYLCVISTLICLGHSFYKDHIQVRRVVIKAIIFQPEYFVSPVMFTIYEYWHLTLCQREHFLCMWFTQTGETFKFIYHFISFSQYKCLSEYSNTENKFSSCKFTV